MTLEGKTALVTGAGRGIGRAIALAYAEEGCDVVCVARSSMEIEATAADIAALGRRALALPCDVCLPAAVEEMARNAVQFTGAIDVLVNNAGYANFKPFWETSLEDWQRTFDTNLTSAFLCTRAVLPQMMSRRSGRIINISSVSALKPIVNQSAYCAAKAAMNAMTTTLAMELRGYGIGVHAICPGGVQTRLADEAMPDRDKSGWMTPEDIAQAALYLAKLSPRAATDILYVRRFDSAPLGG